MFLQVLLFPLPAFPPLWSGPLQALLSVFLRFLPELSFPLPPKSPPPWSDPLQVLLQALLSFLPAPPLSSLPVQLWPPLLLQPLFLSSSLYWQLFFLFHLNYSR